MPRLSITLSAAALTIGLAPAAFAYATDPAPGTLQQVALQATQGDQVAEAADTCVVKVTPLLASIIGLDPDWRTDGISNVATALACADE